jgi:alkyl sulfatase BDS1-like metallo-beta-lactamase superfamily hydrolase
MLQPDGTQQLQAYAQRSFAKEIVQVAENIYYFTGYGHSNATLVIGDTSCILIDTLDSDVRAHVLKQEIAAITAKPVKTIIYTHGHPDHRGGGAAFADTVEEVIAFAPKRTVLKHTEKLNQILMLRGARQFGGGLSEEELITQGLGPREGHFCGEGGYAFLPPTTVYTEENEVTRTIAGVTLKLISAVGETDDQIFIWLPESKVLCCGDNFYPCWPNLSAIRGSQYRDVSAWIDSLDAMRTYPAETLLPGHSKALQGHAVIQEMLKNYRDAIEFVLLQTLEGMNQGKTVDELAASIQLPDSLRNLPYLEEHYGTVAWSVRGIFDGYVGWFDGNPTKLNPLPAAETAANFLRMMGGTSAVLAEIQQAIAAQQYQWAMQLCDLLLDSSQAVAQARQYKAQCCLALAEQETSSNGRHYYLVYAKELLQG